MTQPFYRNLKAADSGVMLAGVCSRLATRLGWNVWAIRAVLLILLVAKPLWTIIAYAAAALLIRLLDGSSLQFGAGSDKAADVTAELRSPELAGRKQRIDELEQRFRDWEQSLPKD